MEMFGNGASADISKPAASAAATAAVDQTNDIAIMACGRAMMRSRNLDGFFSLREILDDPVPQYEWMAVDG